jgi:hypothetical protein
MDNPVLRSACTGLSKLNSFGVDFVQYQNNLPNNLPKYQSCDCRKYNLVSSVKSVDNNNTADSRFWGAFHCGFILSKCPERAKYPSVGQRPTKQFANTFRGNAPIINIVAALTRMDSYQSAPSGVARRYEMKPLRGIKNHHLCCHPQIWNNQ